MISQRHDCLKEATEIAASAPKTEFRRRSEGGKGASGKPPPNQERFEHNTEAQCSDLTMEYSQSIDARCRVLTPRKPLYAVNTTTVGTARRPRYPRQRPDCLLPVWPGNDHDGHSSS